MAGREEEIDLITDILTKPFSRPTCQEKLDFVRKGQPTSKLASHGDRKGPVVGTKMHR